MSILTINGGSSSIRFAVFETGDALQEIISGKVDRIGLSGTTLSWQEVPQGKSFKESIAPTSKQTAVTLFIDWLVKQPFFTAITAVGHRVVHGLQHSAPMRLTEDLLKELHGIRFDPEHLPMELELLEAFRKDHSKLEQVVCFDTAFHRTMPRVASIVPIPRRFESLGIRRYGFHGLSYEFLLNELRILKDPAAEHGRIILAHLGNGASMAAVLNGECIDTTMGFTPASGLVMGTRCGDLDPGVFGYLAQQEKMTSQQYVRMVNHDSGLIGISGVSSDVQDLLKVESSNRQAAEALDVFCYQAKKWIGSFAAALGGLDTLVFAGGIGENSPIIRKRICDGLQFLGIDIENAGNDQGADIISLKGRGVTVRVIRTNEELTIARSVLKVLPA